MSDEKTEFIQARLRLAQALLEESDALPGRSGYTYGAKTWWHHPRHEREALVVYLLLTCLDRLGQKRRFMTVKDWLDSGRKQHVTERNQVLNRLPKHASHLEAARGLANEYYVLYGAKNAFYDGIENLSQKGRERLLQSISIQVQPDAGANVSSPAYPVANVTLERDLKLKHLYNKRNRFTHHLDQHHSASTPSLSGSEDPRGSSWSAIIKNDQLYYMGVHSEHFSFNGIGYVITTSNWPFVLFEVLYDAIGQQFDRTSIKLKFHVTIFSATSSEDCTTFQDVEHSRLKDFLSLARNVPNEHDRSQIQ